jgi:DNA invertase Pin-like site-specific DNA recombinase
MLKSAPTLTAEAIMSKTRRLAVSYSRFSDLKQSKGDSEDRQERLFRQFCEIHNLTPLREAFTDRGRSGYKDEHRKKGRLGQLVAMAKDGRFEPGTVIVVEAWDRLGRLRPDKMTQLVSELVQTGIGIGVCRLNDVFAEDDFGTHKWTTLAVFIQLAFQESKQKAERVAASWEKRREQAREGAGAVNHEREGRLRLGPLPAWLESVDGRIRPITERAAAVKRIFRLAAAGHGHTRIVKALTEAGVPPFGEVRVSENRSRSQYCGHWSKPYVALILKDRRAVGEMQPRKSDGQPDGPPLAGYYPAVIAEKDFLLAKAAQGRRRNKDTLGRAIVDRESKYVNTFKGLIRHARDGEGWVLHNKQTAKDPFLLLVSATGSEGRDRCYTFPYAVFETAILSQLREVNPADVLPRQDDTGNRVDELRARLALVRQDLAAIKADLAEGYSKALADVARDKEAQEEKVGQELQDELIKAARPAERAWPQVPTLVDLVAKQGDTARLKLRTILRTVAEDIWLLVAGRGAWRFCAVQVFFVGGEARSYLIGHRTKANRRPEIWWVRSFVDAVKGKDFNLRRRTDAAKLAKLLEAIDPSQLTGPPA